MGEKPRRRQRPATNALPPAITSCQIDRSAQPSIAALSLSSRAAADDGLFATGNLIRRA
jgi:hypothetical protein